MAKRKPRQTSCGTKAKRNHRITQTSCGTKAKRNHIITSYWTRALPTNTIGILVQARGLPTIGPLVRPRENVITLLVRPRRIVIARWNRGFCNRCPSTSGFVTPCGRRQCTRQWSHVDRQWINGIWASWVYWIFQCNITGQMPWIRTC